MKARFLVLIVFGIFFMTHCERDKNPVSPDPDTFIYPTKIGNEWHYNRLYTFWTEDADQQNSVTFPDTSHGTSVLKIVDKVVLRDSITTFQFDETLVEGGRSYSGATFYANRPDGLLRQAYRGAGYTIPKQNVANKIIFKGMVFNSLSQMTNFFTHPGSLAKGAGDSLYYEDPPAKTLVYPLDVGTQWTLIVIENTWRIDKKVVGREKVKTPAGTFKCYKIRYYHDFDGDGEWDDDVIVAEYISSQGLVKRTAQFFGSQMANEGGELVHVFESTEEVELTYLKL